MGGLVTVILLWVIAPFAEFGVIIGLLVKNDRYKKQIAELTKGNSNGKSSSGGYKQIPYGYGSKYGEWPVQRQEPAAAEPQKNHFAKNDDQSVPAAEIQSAGILTAGIQANGTSTAGLQTDENLSGKSSVHQRLVNFGSVDDGAVCDEWEIYKKSESYKASETGERTVYGESLENERIAGTELQKKAHTPVNLGMAALILGVIFIVLAGLIFATTTWHVLPDESKALLVFGCSVLFFGASVMADRLFGIHRTSNAFYVLGSIFLALSVLAAAYFQLLGPEFILDKENRWKVLWVGSLVMEGAFIAGIRRFHDRVYTQASLWGMSVSMFFMARALQITWGEFVSVMTIYALVLVGIKAGLAKKIWRRDKGMQGQQKEGTQKELPEDSFGALVLHGIQYFAPVHFWFFGALTMLRALLVLGRTVAEGCLLWPFSELFGKPLFPADILGAAALFAVVLGMGGFVQENFARKRKAGYYPILFAVSVTEFFHYAACLIPAEFAVQVGLASGLEFLWFWLGRNASLWAKNTCLWRKLPKEAGDTGADEDGGEFSLRTGTGDIIYTAVLALNVWHVLAGPFVFCLSSSFYCAAQWAAASVVVVFLAAAVGQWGRERRKLRAAIPWILWILTITGNALCMQLSGQAGLEVLDRVSYEWILFAFLFGIGLWDVWKKDYFGIAVLGIGTAAQFFYLVEYGKALPFALIVAAWAGGRKWYLRGAQNAQGIRRGTGDLFTQEQYAAAALAYAMVGAYVLMGHVTDREVLRMTAVNLFFFGLAVPWLKTSRPLVWDICGCAACVYTVIGYYLDQAAGTEDLLCCLAAFAGYYLWFYLGKRQWPHLLAAVSILPMPFIAEARLILDENQFRTVLALVIVGSCLLERRFFPIMKRDEAVQGGWRMDWVQILAIFILLCMASMGNERWWFVYVLLSAMYFLQYRVVEGLKKSAYSLSACLLAVAVWGQPFISWPDWIELELRLLPAVWLIWTLGAIWGRAAWIKTIQTIGYVACLTLLVRDALASGLVVDALIVEAVCLAVFIWSQVKKNILWVWISGAVLLGVVVFMTKDFWLSISWWVYLLAAGIGLIVFAAAVERKRRKEEEKPIQ